MINKLRLSLLLILALLILNGCNGIFKNNPTDMSELDTISFNDLSSKAYDYLIEQQEIVKSKYKLSGYEDWFYDQETGKLTFSDSGVDKLIINYEDVGSFSLVTNTWLWAWDNEHTEPKVKSEIVKIKEYGLKRSFEKLTKAKWDADEIDGWEMTGISAYLMKAKGAYRVKVNNDSLMIFMIFKEINWADTIKIK